MNEIYVECMVPHKKSPIAGAFKYIMWVLAVIMFIGGLAVNSLLYVLAILFAVLAYFVSPNLDIEYEYLYVDKSIRVDKVMSKEKRKKVVEIDLNKMEIMAFAKSHDLDSYRTQNLEYKEYASGEENARVFVIVYSDKQSRKMVGIEPNEELLNAVKSVFPRKVIEY